MAHLHLVIEISIWALSASSLWCCYVVAVLGHSLLICVTLDRDLYYQDPVLFGSQDSLDSLVDDAALIIQVPRSQLHVVFVHVCWSLSTHKKTLCSPCVTFLSLCLTVSTYCCQSGSIQWPWTWPRFCPIECMSYTPMLLHLPGLRQDPLKTRAIPERLRGVFTTRHYTNSRLPLLYLYQSSQVFLLVFFSLFSINLVLSCT